MPSSVELGLKVRRTDIGDGRGDADFNAGITLFSQFASEELVQLCIENTIGDELAALGDCLGLSRPIFGISASIIKTQLSPLIAAGFSTSGKDTERTYAMVADVRPTVDCCRWLWTLCFIGGGEIVNFLLRKWVAVWDVSG